MIDINAILEQSPYSLSREEKGVLMNQVIRELTKYHAEHCEPYRKILQALNLDLNNLPYYTDLPFLPVRLFKEFDLVSVPRNEVVKTMTSSGTTGQAVSKIYLDRETSSLQTKVLAKIVSSFIGNQRVPMLILDSSEVIKNRAMFSARGAGILGFSGAASRSADILVWFHFYDLAAFLQAVKGTGFSSGSKQRIADTWRRLEEIDFGESKSGRV